MNEYYDCIHLHFSNSFFSCAYYNELLVKRAICCDRSSSFKYMYTSLAISKHIKRALSVKVS